MRLLRDQSGASAAEYALIVAFIATPIAIASIAFGSVVNQKMGPSFYGPGGVKYTCTANCQYEDLNFCSAHRGTDAMSPTFSPVLPPRDPAFCGS